MAKAITALDAHTIMNLLQAQALGSVSITSTDTSSFVSAGESVLNTGIENTINALTVVFGKTVVAVRPYEAKITLIQEEDTGLYTNRIRKISFYDKGSKEAGWQNTDAHNRNLYNGYDNTAQGTAPNGSVGSMWEQDKPVAVEFHFGGTNLYDFEITFYPDQLKAAFRSPEEFADFWNGMILHKQNEIEQYKENKNRMTLLNYMAGLYDMSMAVDLVAEYNAFVGSGTFTGSDLRPGGSEAANFMKFFVAFVKKLSSHFTERTTQNHWNPTVIRDGVTYTDLPRHTPRSMQKLFLHEDLITDAEAWVLPTIFNDKFLRIENYESVSYWQSVDQRMGINVTPAIPDTSNPSQQTVGTAVALDYVVGVLFDQDACITNFQYEGTDPTPKEARKKYQNEWIHTAFNSINDFTEKGILLYMAS